MKKINLFILLALVLCLSACGTDTQNESSEDTVSATITDATPSSEEITASEDLPSQIESSEIPQPELSETSEEETQAQIMEESTEKPYYGQWKVIDFLAPGITALSTEEMEGYINVTLAYSIDFFTVGNVSRGNLIYTETTVTKDDFAADYNNQVTFDHLCVSADSITDVSIANSSGFGSMFYVADEDTLYIYLDGAFFKAVRQSEDDDSAFKFTERVKDFLAHMCLTLADLDFSSPADMDESFWVTFIFCAYTDGFPYYFYDKMQEEEQYTRIYREDLGYDEDVTIVSLEEVEAYAKLVFGIDLPDIKPTLEDIPEEYASRFYKDGYYYIGISDFPDYTFIFNDCTVNEEGDNTYAIVTYNINYFNITGEEDDVGIITFIIYPADNENGFIIASKTQELFRKSE